MLDAVLPRNRDGRDVLLTWALATSTLSVPGVETLADNSIFSIELLRIKKSLEVEQLPRIFLATE